MDMKRFFLYFITIAALTLAGCGGGGGGTSLMVGGERATQDAIDGLDSMLTAAQGQVMDLEGELATATGDVTRLTGELATATGDVTRLTGELGMATGDVTRLTGELATATGDVTRLTGELGMATGDVTRLTGELGTAKDTITSLEAEVVTLRNRPNITSGAVQAMMTQIAAFKTAQNSRDSAMMASSTATTKVMEATEKSLELTTLSVGGNSRLAEDNADDVLEARDAVNRAVDDAADALDSATGAKPKQYDEENPSALVRALKLAIMVADDAVNTTTMAKEGDALKEAVELVTGNNPDAEGYPMMPGDHGKAVAMDIGGALMPMDASNGSRMRGTYGDMAPDGYL